MVHIKQDLENGDLPRAKEAIDSYTFSEPDSASGWMLKARVYNSISNAPEFKELAADSRTVSFKSMEKAWDLNYQAVKKELEPENYQLAFDIYKGYTNDGIAFFNAGTEKQNKEDYLSALKHFKKAAQVNGFINRNGWGAREPDINNLYYSFYSSLYADKQDETFVFCKKIADNNLVFSYPNKDFEPAYQWLVFYLRQKNNAELLKKYTIVAMQNIPESPYFASNYIDWLKETKQYEEMFEWYRQLTYNFPGDKQYQLNYLKELLNHITNDTVAQKSNWQAVLETGLNEFILKYPTDAPGRLLIAKYYLIQAAALKKALPLTTGQKARIKQYLELANQQLRVVADKQAVVEPTTYQESLKLLIANLTSLKHKQEADRYSLLLNQVK
ncbi:MAG: hypothetical protein QM791_02890 [Ferruginibacter sp.]